MGPLIALLTDFGTRDTYVGVMKAVIATIAPKAHVVDLTHEVRPQDVRGGAYALLVAAPYFPPDTIFVAVVDPGVGGARRPLALRAGGKRFVGPDNGLFSEVLRESPADIAVLLADPRYRLPDVSTTFHGRDIFAPAAAHMAAGVPLEALGPHVDSGGLVMLPEPRRFRDAGGVWHGEVLHVDHFGNLVTTLRRRDLDVAPEAPEAIRSAWMVVLGDTEIKSLNRTFADVEPGEPLAYFGSDGYLEIAVRDGDAAGRLRATVGTALRAWQMERG